MSYCVYCGYPLSPEAKACPRCGANITAEGQTGYGDALSQASAPQEEPPVVPPAEAQPVQQAAQSSAGSVPPPAPQYMPAGNVGGYPPPAQPVYGPGGYGPYVPALQPPEPLGIGTVVGMLLLGGIPLVGWIVMLIWAFDHSPRPNRRNLARGILIVKLIGTAIVVLLWILLIAWGYGMASMYYYY